MNESGYHVDKSERVVAIGQRIKAVRVGLRISQREMAAALNTSASYLSEIESGKANPGPEFFLALSDVYNVSIEYVFHGEGEMFFVVGLCRPLLPGKRSHHKKEHTERRMTIFSVPIPLTQSKNFALLIITQTIEAIFNIILTLRMAI